MISSIVPSFRGLLRDFNKGTNSVEESAGEDRSVASSDASDLEPISQRRTRRNKNYESVEDHPLRNELLVINLLCLLFHLILIILLV